MIIRNTNPFEYYIIQQLFNDVNVPRCLTENLSYQNIFIPFKYTLLLFSRFYFLGQKYKGHDFLRAGAFSSVAPPSATRLTEDMFLPEQSWKKGRTNVRTKFWQYNNQHSNDWNEQYDLFENLSRMFERADGKQPKNDWRDQKSCPT